MYILHWTHARYINLPTSSDPKLMYPHHDDINDHNELRTKFYEQDRSNIFGVVKKKCKYLRLKTFGVILVFSIKFVV